MTDNIDDIDGIDNNVFIIIIINIIAVVFVAVGIVRFVWTGCVTTALMIDVGNFGLRILIGGQEVGDSQQYGIQLVAAAVVVTDTPAPSQTPTPSNKELIDASQMDIAVS